MHARLDESFTTLSERFRSFQTTYIGFRRQSPTAESLEELDMAHLALLSALEEFQLAMRALHEPVLGNIAAETLDDGQNDG